jgi:hypothetical protein
LNASSVDAAAELVRSAALVAGWSIAIVCLASRCPAPLVARRRP